MHEKINIDQILTIAEEAGKATLEIYNREFIVEEKDDSKKRMTVPHSLRQIKNPMRLFLTVLLNNILISPIFQKKPNKHPMMSAGNGIISG